MVTVFNDNMDRLDFLTDEEKTEFKEQNKEAVQNSLIPAFENIITVFTDLKGTGKNRMGICNYEGGKEYYEYLLKTYAGTSKSADEVIDMLDNELKNLMTDIYQVYFMNKDAYEYFASNYDDIFAATNEMSASDMIDRMMEDASENYPDIGTIHYQAEPLDKSLETIMDDVLAYYMAPAIDDPDNNLIRYNGMHTDGMWTTLAHEGYPGHMYQTQYFAATNPDWIRYILAPGGYVEGWASYVEVLSYNYAQTGNDALNKMYAANYATVLCLYAKGDIGVNYYGWSEDDVYKYISQYGFDDKSVAHEMYYAFVSDPGNYCKYVLGMLGFEQLKTKAQSELSDKFNLKNFHQYILDMGPVQFDILFNNLDAWIKKEK